MHICGIPKCSQLSEKMGTNAVVITIIILKTQSMRFFVKCSNWLCCNNLIKNNKIVILESNGRNILLLEDVVHLLN